MEHVRRARRRFTAEAKRDAVFAWRESGLTAEAFSAQSGIGKTNLWRWSRALERVPSRRRRRRLPTQETASTTRHVPQSTFAEVRVVAEDRTPVTLASRVVCEVDRHDGTRVRLFSGASAETIHQVLLLACGGTPC